MSGSAHSRQAQIDNQPALQHTPTMIEATRRTAIVNEKLNTDFAAFVPNFACGCRHRPHKGKRPLSSFCPLSSFSFLPFFSKTISTL
jgi:hypothetical protein